MSHPHPSREHVMIAYREAILGFKRKFAAGDGRGFRRGARSQAHYSDWVREYLEAKRDVLAARAIQRWKEGMR